MPLCGFDTDKVAVLPIQADTFADVGTGVDGGCVVVICTAVRVADAQPPTVLTAST